MALGVGRWGKILCGVIGYRDVIWACSGDKTTQKNGADTSADKKAVEKLQIMPHHCHIDVDLLPYL